MRALRSCDFCGEQAVGTFEVMPAELDPTEAERRRVVLCDSCKDTLGTLLEPLIERVDVSTDDGETDGKSEREDTDTETQTDLIGTSAEDDGSLLGGMSDGDDESKPGDTADLTGSTQEVAESASSGDDQPTADASDGSAEEPSGAAGQSGGTRPDDKPENYGQVLRLLRNREFPMTREEIVTIATSAYQLDARNVQVIIDEAISRGEFGETNGQLTRGR
jgi:hypothetical protein